MKLGREDSIQKDSFLLLHVRGWGRLAGDRYLEVKF